jgi:glycerol-3-phosphate acyltransferase PlsX
MGGDFGPAMIIAGAVEGARLYGAKLLFVGQSSLIQNELNFLDAGDIEHEIIHASEVAGMNDRPSDILRRKKDASIQVACRLVREGKAEGLISAGHSGATVACGMFIMGRIAGVERPALASVMPTEQKPMILLDVGANVDCRPYHLFQFGLMGAAYAHDLLGYESPRVGIVSIGEEEGKGNTQVKEAYELLKMAQNLNFVGNVEGRDLFTGNVDVVVCDGFVGNVALKLSEGLIKSMSRLLKTSLLTSGLMPKVGAYLARKSFTSFARVVDYAEYGGAPVLGLKSIALVCHGSSNARAICSAVRMGVQFVGNGTTERLIQAISANEELTRYGSSSSS